MRSFLSCLVWGIGYAGMWATKWLLAALALGENVLPYISGHIDERLGTAGGQAGLDLSMAAIWENFRSLFPMGWQPWGWTLFWIAAFLLSYLIYVYRRKRADWSFIAVCSVLGLLPYVRYALLQNHSYTHFFFTYRAQAAGVL
ncbi:MAG: hypothetical protein J6N70_07000, partial [Oribacterium sp.]|nr:hypothetical protein [Oribacterium sp.]